MVRKIMLLTLLLSSAAYSQPYYYYFRYDSAYAVPGYSGDLYRVNLATNSDELFLKDAGRVVGKIFSNSDQSEIFFQVRFSLMAVDVNDPAGNEEEILNGINEVVDIKDSPETGRYYISFMNLQDSTMTVAVSRSTLEPIDTIVEQDTPYESFLSQKQDGLYRLQDDSLGIFFSEYLIDQGKQTAPQRCGELGPFVGSPAQEDARRGYALVSYTNSLNLNLVKEDLEYAFLDQNYVLCDVGQSKTYTPVVFPWRSRGNLSPDDRYAVIQRVDYDTARTGGEFYTGKIYVFNAHTGEINQYLSLAPGGRVLMFDNYPQTFYYYNDSTDKAIAFSDTTVMPVKSLLDTLISMKEQCVANGSIDNQGVANSLDSKLNNARSRLEAGDSTAAKNMLAAFVNEVEAQKGKHLTTGAYLLLKFNAEYVEERLP